MALQSLRGIAQLSAVTIMAEVGELSRFEHPRQLMAYSGAVSSEHTSGARVRRGAISKTGNAHLRRIVVEAAWAYRHRPAVGKTLACASAQQPRRDRSGLEGAAPLASALRARYGARQDANSRRSRAVGRELLGFIWAIGVHVERERKVFRCARPPERQRITGPRRCKAKQTAAVVARGKGEPSEVLCGSLRAQPAPLVARQLPTDHDHDGEARARSTNIRVINRRTSLPRPLSACA